MTSPEPAPTVTGRLKVDDVAYTRVRIDTDPGEDGWCFMTPENHPDDVAKGHVEGQWADGAQFFGRAIATPPDPAAYEGQADVVVIQADRDAAGDVRWRDNQHRTACKIHDGELDDSYIVQAFAAHRLSSLRQQAGEVEALRKEVAMKKGLSDV